MSIFDSFKNKHTSFRVEFSFIRLISVEFKSFSTFVMNIHFTGPPPDPPSFSHLFHVIPLKVMHLFLIPTTYPLSIHIGYNSQKE